MEMAIGVMKEVIMLMSSEPTSPPEKIDRIQEPANPANIISIVAMGPPIFIPKR